jgi:hypothetical protein
MRTVLRFLVVQALMLWQGGFLFYAAVVVPTGTDVLGSAAAQGVITGHVTEVMNDIGLSALIVLAIDARLTLDSSDRRTELRWWCWAVAFLCQLLLYYFHQLLVAFMDPTRTRVVIHPPFRPVHRLYLWTITIQWMSCLLLVWFNLRAWRDEDGGTKADASPSPVGEVLLPNGRREISQLAIVRR